MAAKKTNRCWPGYEPVPGKTQHEEGSCRKKAASKSTASDKKAQAKRQKELDHWQEEHPKTRRSAAQHLHSSLDSAPKKTAAKKKTTAKKSAPAKKHKTTTATKKRRTTTASATTKKRTTSARKSR